MSDGLAGPLPCRWMVLGSHPLQRAPERRLAFGVLLSLAACSQGATPNAGGGTGSGGTSAGASGAGGAQAGNGGTSGAVSAGGSSGTLAGKGGVESSSGGSSGAGAGGDAAGSAAGGEPAAGEAGVGVGGADGGTAGEAGAGGRPPTTFETTTLSSDHVAEGAAIGDIDGDGTLDLVAGPVWYRGPAFEVGGTLFAPVPTFTRDQYSTFFLTFTDDVDGDDLLDVIGIGDPGGGNGSGNPNAFWYRNPGPSNLASTWEKHAIFDGLVASESPALADVVGDATKELVFMTNQRLGYAERGSDPTAPWTFHALSDTAFGTPYVHGLGVGDVNGDGRADVVERSGWWEQPTSGSTWTRHAVDFGAPLGGSRPSNWGGAQIAIYDVDGDGDADIVTALAAHRYGLYWFEQVDSDTFTPHEILPPSATETSVSQLHALAVADLNGDGLLDVVTGKRYYAHPSTNADPGTTEPPLIEWFELSRAGGVTFSPHVIHDDSGVGCNFTILDVTGDAKPDVFTTNKRGTFLHVQR